MVQRLLCIFLLILLLSGCGIQNSLPLPFIKPMTVEDEVKISREFRREAKKSKLLITYVSPKKIEKYVDQILGMSPKTKESLQFLVVKTKKKKR